MGREQITEFPNTLSLLWIREAARLKRFGDLVVEILAVGDNNQRRVFVDGITSKFERKPEHGQALARTLSVPHDTATLGRTFGGTGAGNGLVDRCKLLVATKLADRLAGLLVLLERNEVSEKVEQVHRSEHALEQNLLGVR